MRRFLPIFVAVLLWSLPAFATGPWYVDSVASGGTNAGTSWANAYLTLAQAVTSAANNGDTIYVAAEHNESSATATTIYTLSTNAALPTKIFCANQAGTVPPVTADLCTTATVTTTNGSGSFVFGGNAYVYGLILSVTGTGFQNPVVLGGTANFSLTFESSQFKTSSTSSSTAFLIGTASGASKAGGVTLINHQFSFGSANQKISVYSGNHTIIAKGTSPPALIAGTTPTTLFGSDNYTGSGTIRIIGEDLSLLNSGHNLVDVSLAGPGWFRFIDCKLGASVGVTTGTPANADSIRVSLENSDSGTKNYRWEYYEYSGSYVANTATVHTGGATDGVTPISLQVTTSANATPFSPLKIGPIPIWVGSTGSHTPTIEIATNNLTLNNNDIWVEAQYLGSSATPIATVDRSNRIANFLPSTSAAAQPTSTATWTGVPGTPVKQKLAPSALTFNMLGYYEAFIYVGKASIAGTLFIDPLITVN